MTCLLLLLSAAAPPEVEPVRFGPEGGQVDAERWTIRVPENRADPDSRQIAVRFVRLPSESETPAAPVVYLAGGPGGSGTGAAERRWPLFRAIREVADVVLLDQRGTGLSERLPEYDSPVRYPGDKPVTAELAASLKREALTGYVAFLRKRGVDPLGYTTVQSAADVAAVRDALGVDRVNLLGISYGTHLALATLKDHPDAVDRLVLASTEGLDQTVKLPARVGGYLDRLQAAIDADPAAKDVFPDVRGFIARVQGRVRDDPPTVTVYRRDGTSSKRILSLFDVRTATGYMIADPGRVGGLLRAYREADEEGDFGYFAYFRGDDVGVTGMPELMDTASGISGDRLVTFQEQAAGSPVGSALNFPMPQLDGAVEGLRLPDAFREEAVSDRPCLVLSGTLDGRTFPEGHREATAGLSNRTFVTIPGGGHNLFFDSPDVVPLVVEFLAGRGRFDGDPPAELETAPAEADWAELLLEAR